MTEMIISLPILMSMWFGLDYFRAGYVKRLETLAQSHAEAWNLAHDNSGRCFAGRSPISGFTDALDMDQVGGDAVGQFSQNAGTSSSMFFYGHASSRKTLSTRGSRYLGLSSVTLSGGTYLTCNEVVPAADKDQDVLTPLMELVKSLLRA
jgi:hypothetical protein